MEFIDIKNSVSVIDDIATGFADDCQGDRDMKMSAWNEKNRLTVPQCGEKQVHRTAWRYFLTLLFLLAGLCVVAVPAQAVQAGINWTSLHISQDHAWQSVTYGNGLFVAAPATG